MIYSDTGPNAFAGVVTVAAKSERLERLDISGCPAGLLAEVRSALRTRATARDHGGDDDQETQKKAMRVVTLICEAAPAGPKVADMEEEKRREEERRGEERRGKTRREEERRGEKRREERREAGGKKRRVVLRRLLVPPPF